MNGTENNDSDNENKSHNIGNCSQKKENQNTFIENQNTIIESQNVNNNIAPTEINETAKQDKATRQNKATEQDKIATMQNQFTRMHTISREQPIVSWELRLERLNKLEKLITDNNEIISDIINQDFGRRSKSETLMAEIVPALEEIRYAKKHGKNWMKRKRVGTSIWFLPARSYIQPQPLGVVGIISPWNYPLFLSLPPLIGALTAGNRAMIKLSEHAPMYARWLEKTIPEYFSDDEITVVTGGASVSQAFSSLAFDHLLFTGSTSVGKHIMRAASENLTPVTLELGGKSPVIIDKDCDLDHTVSRIWTGKLLNAGQTCIAPDYVLIPEQLQEEFIKKSKIWIEKHYPDMENNEDYSYLINSTQFKRIQNYLINAKNSPAIINSMTDVSPNIETNFMPPFIVSNLTDDSDLLTNEIFAPILPVVTYQALDEAITYVNNRPRPLALYVFATNKNVYNKVTDKTVSGGACINDTIYHIAQAELPFGGVGHSGMGNYHGRASFETLSHHKGIFKQSFINAMGLLQPPYGKFFNQLMKFIARV